MSRWLGRVLAGTAVPEPAPQSPKSPKYEPDDVGLCEATLSERQAMAEVEGGVPAIYSAAFAKLQLTPPPGLPIPRWLQAVDDAGRFLDAHGAQAAALGWRADDIFAAAGLVRMLNGATVLLISAATATLSDGRTFNRFG